MRVAYASPLPPMSSGIADYSAALAPRLAELGVELELFHEGRVAPASELGARFACRPIGELTRRAESFDVVLYHLGNSLPHHAGILEALLEVPGVVVLHEFMLHHLMRERTLAAGDARGYVEEMRYAAGEAGRRAAQRLLDTHHPVDVWSFPLFERVVDRSRGTVVHSTFARDRVLASRPAAPVERLPFPVELPPLAPFDAARRAAERAAFGLGADDFVLASFGLVTPQKRLGPALAAFARLRAERPGARFLVAGEVSPHYDFAALLDEVGRDGITVTGRLPADRFVAAMASADVAVNLRHPTGGETSASLLALLARGLPAIVSRTGSFAEIPPGAAAQVALDEHEVDQLLALYRALDADPELRRAMGAAARRYVAAEHALPGAAAPWVAALERFAATPRAVALPSPPLAPWNGVEPRIALAASVGRDLADLGLAPFDALADAMVELGLGTGDPAAVARATSRTR